MTRRPKQNDKIIKTSDEKILRMNVVQYCSDFPHFSGYFYFSPFIFYGFAVYNRFGHFVTVVLGFSTCQRRSPTDLIVCWR